MLAVLAVSHFTLWARDNQPPAINVSSAPLNRDPKLGNSYASIVKKAAPSVVNIYSSRYVKQRYFRTPMMSDPYFRQMERTRRENWLGSGIIVTPDGYILTANHVVEGADEIKVGISDDKTEYSAKIIGNDSATDIAVLKISAKNLPAITLGDSSQLEVGDVVLAIGNPFGLGQTVTRGIISALGRSLPDTDEGNSIRHYQDFIQTDASINKGNSGGALVDAEGRLIGINDAIVSPSGTSAGVGFAVPINLARSVLEGIINGGRVARGYLGIHPQDLDAGLARVFGVANSGGALIAEVGEGSPAEKAGLKSGDVIVALNGKKISGAENFNVTVAQLPPGSPVNLEIIRGGLGKKIAATLGELPDENVVPAKMNHPPADTGKADMLGGVSVHNLDGRTRRLLGIPSDLIGALVIEVGQDSNAAEAGLRVNDLIVEINREPVKTAEDAIRFCEASRAEQILVKVMRPTNEGPATRFLSVNNKQRAK